MQCVSAEIQNCCHLAIFSKITPPPKVNGFFPQQYSIILQGFMKCLDFWLIRFTDGWVDRLTLKFLYARTHRWYQVNRFSTLNALTLQSAKLVYASHFVGLYIFSIFLMWHVVIVIKGLRALLVLFDTSFLRTKTLKLKTKCRSPKSFDFIAANPELKRTICAELTKICSETCHK